MDASNPHLPNVISLAEYRVGRDLAARPAPTYLLWYPGLGYVTQNATQGRSRAGKTLHRDFRR
jgi:hypothetical protein